MKEVIHVDEKWFFVAEIDKNKKCYVLPDEDPEYCRNRDLAENFAEIIKKIGASRCE